VHQILNQELSGDFAGYVTVSVDQPAHLEALTVAWGSSVQGGIQYSNFPIRADVSVPYVNEDVGEELQGALDRVKAEFDIIGISAAIVVPGHPAWAVASGNSAPGMPIRSDMLFSLGSATKNYVAALVLKLSEEGLLSLDDPINRWLPALNNVDGRVSIGQLLNHTSGIATFSTSAFWAAVFGDPNRRWRPEEVFRYVGPPNFAPGTNWNYSNTNYTLLGMIVQKATGSRLSEELRRRLLNPLGLTRTYCEAEEAIPGTIAHGWYDLDGNWRNDDMSVIPRTSQYSAAWAAGDMVATAADVARWAWALFEGKVLSPGSLRKMLNFIPLSDEHPPIVGYGMGALRAIIADREYWGHGGNIFGYTTIMLYDPRERVSIAILINQDFVDYAVAPPLFTAIMNALHPVLSDSAAASSR
jgi:D-alanyl-D-alanine carboxypeptidase